MDPSNMVTAFAVWAAVVGLIGMAIVWELARLRAEVRNMADMLNQHQIQMEGRLTAVETHLSMKDGFRPSHHFGNG